MSRTLKVVQNDADIVPAPQILDFSPAPGRLTRALARRTVNFVNVRASNSAAR
jgi:hypothetical protein